MGLIVLALVPPTPLELSYSVETIRDSLSVFLLEKKNVDEEVPLIVNAVDLGIVVDDGMNAFEDNKNAHCTLLPQVTLLDSLHH